MMTSLAFMLGVLPLALSTVPVPAVSTPSAQA
jgi:multidrug efflux pump subunit AcrB